MGIVEPALETVAEAFDGVKAIESGQGLDDLLFPLEAVDRDDNRFIQEFLDLERRVAGRGRALGSGVTASLPDVELLS
jgi:hypothetical protein